MLVLMDLNRSLNLLERIPGVRGLLCGRSDCRTKVGTIWDLSRGRCERREG